MFYLKSVWEKKVNQSFKSTKDGLLVFFPEVRPNLEQGYIIPDENTKSSILSEFEKNRKLNNWFLTFMIVCSAILIGILGNLVFIVVGIIGFIVSDYSWNKRVSNIVSLLEKYNGPEGRDYF